MKSSVLIGVMGFLGIMALFVYGGQGLQSASLADGLNPILKSRALEDSAGVSLQLKAAIQEVNGAERAYRTAQAEVKEATHQIRSFLPVALEGSEQVKTNWEDLVVVFGVKKASTKEKGSSQRFVTCAIMEKLPNFDPLLPFKPLYRVLRL